MPWPSSCESALLSPLPGRPDQASLAQREVRKCTSICWRLAQAVSAEKPGHHVVLDKVKS